MIKQIHRIGGWREEKEKEEVRPCGHPSPQILRIPLEKVEHLNIKSPGIHCQGFCISYG